MVSSKSVASICPPALPMPKTSPPRIAARRIHVVAIFAASFAMALLAAERAGAYRLGLHFIEAPTPSPPPFLRDFEPFRIVDAANHFVSQGAFANWTETDVQRAIALRVEDALYAIDVGSKSQWLDVSIHLGPAPATLPGQRLNVALGKSAGFVSALGETPRPGDYDNPAATDTLVAAVYLDNLDNLGASLVTYATASGAINAIAGTTAHEIGHVFGAHHVSTSAGESEPLPLMAVEGTGLPTGARLTERRFSTLEPQPTSNAALLLGNIGTGLRGDFNFDSVVDEDDLAVLIANFGMSDRLRVEGDATGDHWVDGADAGRLIANWTAGPMAGAAASSAATLSLADVRTDRGLHLVPEPGGWVLVLLVAAGFGGATSRQIRGRNVK